MSRKRSSNRSRDYRVHAVEYRVDSLPGRRCVVGWPPVGLQVLELEFGLAWLIQDTVVLFLPETSGSFDLIVLVS